MLLALTLIFSVGAIQAGDVNITDSGALTSADDAALQIDESDDSQVQTEDESVNSNTLSTNIEETSQAGDVKNQTEVTSPTNTVYYKGSYSVTLKDSSSNTPIADRTVNFVINNVNYTAKSDKNGVASVDLSLNPGKYTAVAYFAGDDTYLKSNNLTSNLEVLPTVKASDITKYYKGSAQYSATFYDSSGNVLANRDVVISVGGKSYSVKTDSKGVASLSINLKPGTYKVVSSDPVTGYKLTTTFRILSTISASATTKGCRGFQEVSGKILKKQW